MPDLVLDLSNNNQNPNFRDMARDGVKGVMLKVSEGATFKDPVFADWSRRARNQGLRVGGYHFAQPSGGDALAEARWFVKNLGAIRFRDFKPALDLESNAGSLSWEQLESWSRVFNQEVKRLTGKVPMLYASRYWIERMKPDRPIGGALWLAQWSNDGRPFKPVPPAPWERVPMHQFTSEALGRSPLHPAGVPGRVDINQVFHWSRVVANPTSLLVPNGVARALSL